LQHWQEHIKKAYKISICEGKILKCFLFIPENELADQISNNICWNLRKISLAKSIFLPLLFKKFPETRLSRNKIWYKPATSIPIISESY